MNTEYLSMTFEQLMERQRYISKKYGAACGAGSNQDVIDQMLLHMDAIRNAMWELGYKQQFDQEINRSIGKTDFDDSIVN